jgi:endogenous inhibitor of DNA gyrase (YacG/DUF329 family)
MSADDLDIDCPNCGRSLSADASICPFCLVELRMADLEELERVSREDYVPESSQTKFEEGHIKSEGIVVDEDASEGRVSFRGRLFSRGKK